MMRPTGYGRPVAVNPAVRPGVKPAAPAMKPGVKPGYKVTSNSKKNETGIQTLVGDYEEKGTNHGKKFYQKAQKIEGHENVKVFLYYWDARDGAEFSGWWFGDQVGGSQVWARAPAHTPQPPKVGWKVPWDADRAEPGLLTVDPAAGGFAPATAGIALQRPIGVVGAGAGAGATPSPTQLKGKIAEATKKVEGLEANVQNILATCKGLAATSGAAELQAASAELLKQQQALMAVQKQLTQDITEARKGGLPAMSSVTEFSKLSPRLRTLQTGMAQETAKVKGWAAKAMASAANSKKTAETAAANKAAEEKDSKEFQETLPATKELVGAADESVEAIVLMAAPLIADPPDDDGAVLNKATEEVELAAKDAQAKITEARSQINNKLQTARKFAPETRKTALTEFSQLQQTLTEAQKKLNPYRAFKKEFKDRVEARKSLQEMSDKLAANELEVEKVKMMTSVGSNQMTEDEISSAEKVAQPVKAAIENMLKALDQKMRAASGAMKDELSALKDKASAVKKELDTSASALAKQRQSFATAGMLKTASEKVDKAEESISVCQDAEMPFLKGIEVLPGEESTHAISACEAAATKAQSAVSQAQTFLRTKLAESKKLVKQLAASVTEELTAHMSRLEATSKKLSDFKKETLERKLAAMMSEVVDALSGCDKKIAVLTKAVVPFSEEGLESASTESLKEALEKTSAAEKEASASMLEVRKVFAAKQKEATASDAKHALAKLQQRVNACQQELVKAKRAASSAEKVIKGKEVLVEEEAKVKKLEEELAAAEKKVKPGEEEAALGIEGANLTDAECEEMANLFAGAQKSLKDSAGVVGAISATAPASLKSLLQKLADRCKASQVKITELLAETRDQRERVMSEAAVRESKAKVAEVEKSLEKVNEAELPYLKGMEIVSVKEAYDTLKQSDEAAKAVQTTLSAARSFVAAKNLELKKFGEAAAKPSLEELTGLNEQITAATSKLNTFKKDTEGRRKTAHMQDAQEKVAVAEASLKKLQEVAESFMPQEGKPAEDKDEAECEKLVEHMKETQASLTEASSFVASRAKDAQGNAGHTETLKDLQGKVKAAQAQIAKYKKVASTYEQKYNAKKAIVEASGMLAGMDEALKKTNATCAPLTEEGGLKFLVGVSVVTLVTALRNHMKAKELSHEALYKQFSGGAATLSKDAFCVHLAKLPEALGCEELAFDEERRAAMFAHIDADADGNISMAELRAAFKQRFVCVKEITVTDGFDVSKSKTLDKIVASTELETESDPQKDESTGMLRIECVIMPEGNRGFVTMQGNQGTKFIEPILPFSTFFKEAETTISDTSSHITKVSQWFNGKVKEFISAGKEGPLAEARTELSKLRARVSGANEQLSKLRTKMAQCKKEFAKKEADEKNAHIIAKELKEAEAIVAPAKAKFEALAVAAKALEDAAKPIVDLKGAELDAFATPLSLVEDCERYVASINTIVDEVKAVAKEQQELIPKTAKGVMGDARRDLLGMIAKSGQSKGQSRRRLEAVQGQCGIMIGARAGEVATLLRKQMQEKGQTPEQQFAALAGGSDRISEDAFCKHVEALMGASFRPEQVRLLCQNIESGGIGKRRFQDFVQQFFAVVRSIAATDVFDIKAAKTLRKVELEEVVELLEGPEVCEKTKVTRIRGKSLTDGLVGWVTVKGNQGTPFLQEVEKPHYSCQVDMSLDRDFKSEGEAGLVRTLKADEVLELLEGPRKETYQPGLKVKGKAIKDGAVGWFSARDKTGTVFAEADNKYYSCTSSVAMTDSMDIKECKVVRKLAVGELFTVEEGPLLAEETGITRVKGKAMKDDVVGWITIKGNAGTTYAEQSTKHFCILHDVPLTKKFGIASADDQVRQLEKGEAMQVLEGPKEDIYVAETRVKGKALSDGAVGWISLKKGSTKPWTAYYKCKAAAPLHETCAVAEGAAALRDIEAGEGFESLEGPVVEGELLRMKGKAEKDGKVGWVTIKDGQGKRFFES